MNLKSQDHNLENESVVTPLPSEKPCPNCPFLLLDLRDREDFDCCHIISGMRQSLPVRLFKCVLKNILCDACFFSLSSKLPLSHVTSNYEPLHEGNIGICILMKYVLKQF